MQEAVARGIRKNLRETLRRSCPPQQRDQQRPLDVTVAQSFEFRKNTVRRRTIHGLPSEMVRLKALPAARHAVR